MKPSLPQPQHYCFSLTIYVFTSEHDKVYLEYSPPQGGQIE